MLRLSYCLYVFSSTILENKRAEQVLPESEKGWVRGEEQGVEVAQTMYTHMNKCKNNKNKPINSIK
jgi:hypothetical protein